MHFKKEGWGGGCTWVECHIDSQKIDPEIVHRLAKDEYVKKVLELETCQHYKTFINIFTEILLTF